MAFEKAKVIKAAEKFLSQGKINAAIKEYRQIIKHDDSDLTTLNMLGDLLARAGEKEEAATCFLRIAEHYREQEFRLKAIAMYRKIEKLKPRDPAIANGQECQVQRAVRTVELEQPLEEHTALRATEGVREQPEGAPPLLV